MEWRTDSERSSGDGIIVDVLQAIRPLTADEINLTKRGYTMQSEGTIWNRADDYLAWRTNSGETVEIRDIAVYSKRGNGVGTFLIGKLKELAAERNAASAYAFVRASNTIARAFYRKNGFDESTPIPGFYGVGKPNDPPEFCDAVLVVWRNPAFDPAKVPVGR